MSGQKSGEHFSHSRTSVCSSDQSLPATLSSWNQSSHIQCVKVLEAGNFSNKSSCSGWT